MSLLTNDQRRRLKSKVEDEVTNLMDGIIDEINIGDYISEDDIIFSIQYSIQDYIKGEIEDIIDEVVQDLM